MYVDALQPGPRTRVALRDGIEERRRGRVENSQALVVRLGVDFFLDQAAEIVIAALQQQFVTNLARVVRRKRRSIREPSRS